MEAQSADATLLKLASPTAEARWKRAFEKLEQEEKDLLLKNGPDGLSSVSPEQAASIINEQITRHDAKAWTMELKGKPIKLREVGEKLVRFVLCFKDVIAQGCNASPYASLAWSGVSVILQLVGVPSEQSSAMSQGLVRITELLKLYRVRDELYLESCIDENSRWKDFEETVVDLYSRTLSYQAGMIKHLSDKTFRRLGNHIFDKFPWKDWISKIESLNTQCSEYIELFNKSKEEEARSLSLSLMELSTGIQQQMLEWQKTSAQQQQESRRDEREEKLLHSFAFAYEKEKNTRREPVPGTCLWLLEIESFNKWRSEDRSSLMWLSAGPGCGKSVLCRFLVDGHHLRRLTTYSHVYYFFFRDGYDEFSNATNALRAILHQIFSTHPETRLIDHALEGFRSFGGSLRENFDRLWAILLAVASDPRAEELVCAIDGLDECEPESRKLLVSKLGAYYEMPPERKESKLKFFITSRRYDSIRTGFEHLGHLDAAEYVEIDGNFYSKQIEHDIDMVLEAETTRLFQDRSRKDQQKIISRFRNAANRTYLWLSLVLNSLEGFEDSKLKDIEQVLQSIPESLNEAYERILDGPDRKQHRRITRDLLRLVVAASRPLTLTELNVAQAMAGIDVDIDAEGKATVQEDDDLNLWQLGKQREKVDKICGLFIQVFDGKVYLLHQTAREFLIKKDDLMRAKNSWQKSVSITECHELLAEASMNHIILTKLKGLFGGSAIEHFDEYACDEWTGHYRLSGREYQRSALPRATMLCGTAGGAWMSDRPQMTSFEFEDKAHCLCVAARYGLAAVVSDAIGRGADANGFPDSRPIVLAATANHIEVVQILLDNGADVNAELLPKATALSMAVLIGHRKLIRLLIDRGAKINIQNLFGKSALHVAAELGDREIFQLLIQSGADVNLQDLHGNTALHLAGFHDSGEIVQLLLKRSADLSIKNIEGNTVLHEALYRGRSEVVKILLNQVPAIASVDNPDIIRTLHCASKGGFLEIVQMLIDGGLDVNSKDKATGLAALHCASREGQREIVRMLLKGGAEMNGRGEKGRTALHEAATFRNWEVARLLLDNGADANARDQDGMTALHENARLWFSHDSQALAQMLLKRGVDINIRDNEGLTALYYATLYGSQGSVQLLLDEGADVNVYGCSKKNHPLHLAVILRRRRIAQLLLDHGARYEGYESEPMIMELMGVNLEI